MHIESPIAASYQFEWKIFSNIQRMKPESHLHENGSMENWKIIMTDEVHFTKEQIKIKRIILKWNESTHHWQKLSVMSISFN